MVSNTVVHAGEGDISSEISLSCSIGATLAIKDSSIFFERSSPANIIGSNTDFLSNGPRECPLERDAVPLHVVLTMWCMWFSLHRDGAAISSGLIHEGDELLAIDGESTSDLSVSEVAARSKLNCLSFKGTLHPASSPNPLRAVSRPRCRCGAGRRSESCAERRGRS